jgi:hypothetical protein
MPNLDLSVSSHNQAEMVLEYCISVARGPQLPYSLREFLPKWVAREVELARESLEILLLNGI